MPCFPQFFFFFFSSLIRECKKEEINVCQTDPTPSPGGICLSSVSKSPAPHTCSWISMALPKLGTGREPCDIDLFSPWQQQIKTRSRGEGRLVSRKLHDQYIPQASFPAFGRPGFPSPSLHFHRFHTRGKGRAALRTSATTALLSPLLAETSLPSSFWNIRQDGWEKRRLTIMP